VTHLWRSSAHRRHQRSRRRRIAARRSASHRHHGWLRQLSLGIIGLALGGVALKWRNGARRGENKRNEMAK